MITFHITTEVKDDRQVLLTLPPEVPIGPAELVVSVDAAAMETTGHGSTDWLEVRARGDGTGQNGYPLRGSVLRYEQPTEPVAEDDWETMR
jgi:hypothetical protein